jgi:hypothetical protein
LQQGNVEMQTFPLPATVPPGARLARTVRVVIDSYHQGATGGGFLFFQVDALPAATVCEAHVPVPGNATITFEDEALKAADRRTGYVGQVATFTCDEGYEFADTPAPGPAAPAPWTPLAALAVPAAAWSVWTEGPCSVSCGPGTRARTRGCDTPGACAGDYSRELVACDDQVCRKS